MLGVDYEDRSLTTVRSPAQQLHDFMLAAVRRATDPEGWKAWSQVKSTNLKVLVLASNEAKEETKAAVAAGWKAMTDGTVVEFLSQPNAINAPVFKAVSSAFESMGKDPEAANKAFETLGNIVIKASEGYSNLPEHEKGKVIGKIMFAMVNPEGSTEGAESAIKIADQVATHVDQSVLKTIEHTLNAVEQAAKTSPELANETKQVLLDYIKSKGLTASDLEKAGEIPKGYFDNLAGKGGGWDVLNERPSADVVQQLTADSCVSACGEMLTKGAIKQDILIEQLRLYWPQELLKESMTANIEWLAKELGPEWKGGLLKIGDATKDQRLNWLLGRGQTWCAELHEAGKVAHAVIVDGVDEAGNIAIGGRFHATKYE